MVHSYRGIRKAGESSTAMRRVCRRIDAFGEAGLPLRATSVVETEPFDRIRLAWDGARLARRRPAAAGCSNGEESVARPYARINGSFARQFMKRRNITASLEVY